MMEIGTFIVKSHDYIVAATLVARTMQWLSNIAKEMD
jgi:hypothetical protein